MRRRRVLELTQAEVEALWLACNVYGQEVDEAIHGGPEAAAFRRAKAKLERLLPSAGAQRRG